MQNKPLTSSKTPDLLPPDSPRPSRLIERRTLRAERDALRVEVAELRKTVKHREAMIQAMATDLARIAAGVSQEAPAGHLRDFADVLLARLGQPPTKRSETPGLVVVQGGVVRDGG